MDKEYLNRVFIINSRLELAEEKLNTLNKDYLVLLKTGLDSKCIKNEIDIAKKDVLNEIKALVDAKCEITKAIQNIEDITVRTVFEYHFLCLMTFDKIAEAMHYSVRQIMRYYNKGLTSV